MPKVLIVDDSPVDRRLAGKLLEKRHDPGAPDTETGLTMAYAADGREALAAIEKDRPDVVITDLQMPEMNGLNLVLQVRIRHPLLPVILMTAKTWPSAPCKAGQRATCRRKICLEIFWKRWRPFSMRP